MKRGGIVAGLALLAACGGSSGGGPGDGEDAGSRPRDASVARDAGGELDGGAPMPEEDAGTAVADAGGPVPMVDAGPGPVPSDAGPPDPTAVERTYRVLHWNIAGGAENDCETGPITRAVRRYVADHDVDFVGLNEVCPAQHDAIEAALRAQWGLAGGETFAAYVGDALPRVVGNSIFSRFGLRDVTRHRVGDDMYGERNLLCGHVADLPHLRFCSAHLTPADATARAQLALVLDRIEMWWMDRRDTVILSGDLNLGADHAAMDTVYSAAADTRNNPDNRGHYRELDDADPMHCPGYGERSLPGTAGGPCGEGGKIDFIFVRANRIVDGTYEGDTFDIPADCTGVCSDHRAVFGRVRVRVAVD